MGFFSKLFGKGKSDKNIETSPEQVSDASRQRETIKDNGAPAETVSDAPRRQGPPAWASPETSLTGLVEHCFHYNARCLGTALLVATTRSSRGELPGFCRFLMESGLLLSTPMEELLETRSGSSAKMLVPSTYSRFLEGLPSSDFAHYTLDMGYLSLKETEALAEDDGTGFDIEAKTLKRTAEKAIAESLSLLQTALFRNEDDVSSIFLGDASYLGGLATYYLLLQLNLARMMHPDSLVFIPDSSLNPNSDVYWLPMWEYDYEMNDSLQIAPVPEPLSLVFLDGESANIAIGHHEIGGISGTVFRVQDAQVPGCIDIIAESFVEGIGY